MEVTENYADLQDKIALIGGTNFYKPSKGDIIDECFAQFVNAAQLEIPIRRISPGRYQFGTKQITMQLRNDSLIIRVGGGFMLAEQFIKDFGPSELAKLKNKQEHGDNKSMYSGSRSGSRSPNNPRSVGSNPDMKVGIGELRQWMKQELKENPRIKPAELQKRIRKGNLLNSDISSELDDRHDALANLDLSSVEHEPGTISSKKGRLRPCQSANVLKTNNRQKSQDIDASAAFGNQRYMGKFLSGQNQDLSPVGLDGDQR